MNQFLTIKFYEKYLIESLFSSQVTKEKLKKKFLKIFEKKIEIFVSKNVHCAKNISLCKIFENYFSENEIIEK